MNYRRFKRSLSLLLAVVLTVGLLPAGGIFQRQTKAMAAAQPVTVIFGAQSGSYDVEPVELTVTDGLAEEYGYQVAKEDHNGKPVEGPTVFDCLVAVHQMLYGDAFTKETAKDYLDISYGYISRAFQKSATSSVTLVNGVQPNDGIYNQSYGEYNAYSSDTAVLKDGDRVQYNLLQDVNYWSDYYTWFDQYERTVFAGQETELTLKGYMALFGNRPQEEIDEMTQTISDLPVLVKKAGDDQWNQAGVTDEEGRAFLTFAEPGTYYVTAESEDEWTVIMAPWAVVHVEKMPEWQSAGKGTDNNGVTEAKTPLLENVGLKWVTESLGGYPYGVGAPVIADGFLYLQQDRYLSKIDPETGKVVKQTVLAQPCGYAPSSLAYGDGQLFAAENGCVEAFDLETMNRTWIYRDALGGQAATNIYYRDGRVYTGFYRQMLNEQKETVKGPANYVCLDTEIPKSWEDENKEAEWVLESPYGYYFAGACVAGGSVIFGAEGSEETGDGSLILADKNSGALLKKLEVKGNVRSDISLDESTGKLYFTTDAGYLYQLTVNDSGLWEELKEIPLNGKSTSTPVVYKGVVYVGVCGLSQFGSEGHVIKALDPEQETVLFEEPVAGFPQCSLLLSTGYEAETGKIYLYTSMNSGDGGVTVIEASADGKESKSFDLYIPDQNLRDYSMASLICDEKGTIYYRNDTGRIFALGDFSGAQYGDVDLDGSVGVQDAILVLKHAVHLKTLTMIQTQAANVDGQGDAAVNDAILILKYCVHLIDRFPAENAEK